MATRRHQADDVVGYTIWQHTEQALLTSLLNITIERVYTIPVTTPHPAQNKSLKTLHILQHAQLAYTLAHYRRKKDALATCPVADSV